MKGKGKGKSTARRKKSEPQPEENPAEQNIGFTCDKCGGVFVTEYELDHHDKTDH